MRIKSELRATIKRLKALIDDERKINDAQAVDNIIENSLWFILASKILTYHSLPDEIGTHRHIEKWHEAKQLFLPRVNGNDLDIVEYSPSFTRQGSFNITEPCGDNNINPHELDLIIVPGVAFDLNGNRLGRGKGYYDRLLNNTNALKIGIGYDCQLLEQIPAEPHDAKMDAVITPNNIIILNHNFLWQ